MPNPPDPTPVETQVAKLLETQVARLQEAGADPLVVCHLLAMLTAPPRHHLLVAAKVLHLMEPLKEASQILHEAKEQQQLLDALENSPHFTTCSVPLQRAVLGELMAILKECNALEEIVLECLLAIEAFDPWLHPLRKAYFKRRRRGRPSALLADLFMAVLAAHLPPHPRQAHYQLIGEVTQQLFPDTLKALDLQEAVRKRIGKIRSRYPVDALLAFLTSD